MTASHFFMRTSQFRPMLAVTVRETPDRSHQLAIGDVLYPVIATPKLDGVRCITMEVPDGAARCLPVTRALNAIPNMHIRQLIGSMCPPGLDGELMCANPHTSSFNAAQSSVMRYDGTPEFEYHVFDYLPMFRDPRHVGQVVTSYTSRLATLKDLELPQFCRLVPYTWVYNLAQLRDFIDEQLAAGYEGACFRLPHSPYKFGRSTKKEQWLCKVKSFIDAEAVILKAVEEVANANAPEIDALGYQVRSQCGEGMRPTGRLGAFIVRDVETGSVFKVGSGLTAQDRDYLWRDRESLIGRHITYRYQPHGMVDRPRIPVFVGLRPEMDPVKPPQGELSL